jgi:serine/threonine protein kinase
MHHKKILHRDIKPMNVFIGKSDIVKLGDLGIAKILKNNAAAQTQIGTPHYMAPEIWKGRPYTYGADVWSLGCLLYEMLTYTVRHLASMPSIRSILGQACRNLGFLGNSTSSTCTASYRCGTHFEYCRFLSKPHPWASYALKLRQGILHRSQRLILCH